MMLTVIINCGFMTLSKPPEFVEDILEHVFMTIYTLECIVKIVARGFFVDQLSYVRDPWNLVDLFVVGLGYIMQIIDLISPYIRMGKGYSTLNLYFAHLESRRRIKCLRFSEFSILINPTKQQARQLTLIKPSPHHIVHRQGDLLVSQPLGHSVSLEC